LEEHITSTATIKPDTSEKEQHLRALYQEVRDIRENKTASLDRLLIIFEEIQTQYPHDWLLSLEMYELVFETGNAFAKALLNHLNSLKTSRPEVAHLIENGIGLLDN
jgi:phenylalanine-4-hydroxylase